MQLNFEKEIQWLLKENYRGEASPAFQRDVQRLQAGEPIDYVIGWKDFLGCTIDLSRRPLIPRPETEWWVGQAITNIRKQKYNKQLRVLDLFAGSGCIGIAVLKHCPATVVHVDFGEKYKQWCDQITHNCVENGIPKNKYRVIQTDIFSNIHKAYDYILANPPYIAQEKINKVQKSVLQYEPHTALFSNAQGLNHIARFLKTAPAYVEPRTVQLSGTGARVKPHATIYMEFDSWQKPLIASILKRLGYKQWAFHKDQFGKWRWAEIHMTS